jgi:hypothetical protein
MAIHKKFLNGKQLTRTSHGSVGASVIVQLILFWPRKSG